MLCCKEGRLHAEMLLESTKREQEEVGLVKGPDFGRLFGRIYPAETITKLRENWIQRTGICFYVFINIIYSL